jgi:hypothetical protein
MFTRSSTNNAQQPVAAAVGPRRAFRDVTNANRNGSGKSKNVAAKRTSAVKTRSQLPLDRVSSTAVARQAAVNNALDERDASSTAREISNDVPSLNANADPNSYQMTGCMDNIDERDKEDPLCATAYVEEMYTHFREMEERKSVRPLYMETQQHINERMRAILVDWLVEVHLKFKLVPETLYLTVNLIDRYLERTEVSRPKLQLVGVTCLLIASKYEEIYPPELRDLVYICDKAYTRQDIIEMEEKVLRCLEYNITIPSAHVFLVRFLKAGHADKKIVQLACCILDGTLQSYNLLHYLPSQLAAAAVFIARRTCGRNAWSPTLLRYAGYCEEEVVPIARAILAEKTGSSQELRAVCKKYTSHRYGSVAGVTLSSDF